MSPNMWTDVSPGSFNHISRIFFFSFLFIYLFICIFSACALSNIDTSFLKYPNVFNFGESNYSSYLNTRIVPNPCLSVCIDDFRCHSVAVIAAQVCLMRGEFDSNNGTTKWFQGTFAVFYQRTCA